MPVQAADKRSILWGGRLPFLRELKYVRWPNNAGLQSNSEPRKLVGHDLISGCCYVGGVVDRQGPMIGEDDDMMPEKIWLV